MGWRDTKDSAAYGLYQQTIRWAESVIRARPVTTGFLGLFAPLVLLRAALLESQRIPIGHDAFQYLYLQFVSFNEAVNTGRPPLWYPFMAHGMPAGIWIVLSQGLLTSLLFPLAPLLKGINFLWIYHAGLLFDEAALLIGCLLLARRCYRSTAAVLFVSAAITYTSISSKQVWFDLHAYYLLPLILYCALSAFETGAARYLLWCGLFAAATVLGNLPYFLPYTAFILCTFACAYFFFDTGHGWRQVSGWWSKNRRQLVLLLLPAILMTGTALIYPLSSSGMAFDIPGRGAGGNVGSLTSFLTYGGHNDFAKYWGLVGRFANDPDMTIYPGLLVVPFAVATLFCVRSRLARAFGLTALALALFSSATLVSAFFFYAFPLGRMFRHIALVAPSAKVFLIFYSGFGVDYAWQRRAGTGDGRRPFLIALMAQILLFGPELLHAWANLNSGQNRFWNTPGRIALALIGYMAFVIVAIILFGILRRARVDRAYYWGALLLGLHIADVGLLKMQREYAETPVVPAAFVALFSSYDDAFPFYRTLGYGKSERVNALAPYLFSGPPPASGEKMAPLRNEYGGQYCTIDSFLYADLAASPFRTEEWLQGVGAFHDIWVKQRPARLGSSRLGHPIPDAVAYRRLSGIDAPKLQLFSRLYLLSRTSDVVTALREKDLDGGMLFTTNADAGSAAVVKTTLRELYTRSSSDDRLPPSEISVTAFRFDSIHIRVSNPSSSPAVLYFADGYDPRWQASVNSVPAWTAPTNLGYKSVIVPPGVSEVTWEFGKRSLVWLVWSMLLLGILATCAIVWLAMTDLAQPAAASVADASFLIGKRPRWAHHALVTFAAMYYVVYILAAEIGRGGLWPFTVRLAPHDPGPGAYLANHLVWLALTSAAAALIGILAQRVEYVLFIRYVALAGLTLDLVGVMVLGQIADWSMAGVLAHAIALACVGYLASGEYRRSAWLLGAFLVILAWLGPLPELYGPPAWSNLSKPF